MSADDLKPMSAAAFARLLGWSPRTLRTRADAWGIPYMTDLVSGRRLYDEASYRAWRERAGTLAAERKSA